MKVNIIHMGFLYSGGGERVVLQQTKHLRKRGHKVKLYSPIIRWNKSFPDKLKEVKPERIVPHLPLPFPFREASAMVASSILPFKYKEMANCDVLLCHSQPSMWIGYRLNKMFGTPYVGYLHQLTTFIHKRPEIAGNWASKGDFLALDGLLGGLGKPIARVLDRECHLNANHLIFNSKWTRDLFKKEYGLMGTVCYPAIEEKKLLPFNRLLQIITASRHYPWKRIDLAFQVLKALKDEIVKLIVAGEETAYTKTLKQMTSQLELGNRIKFTGFVTDEVLDALYASSMAYVQTSIYEPFGLGPLEAQSFGTPAVVWGDSGVRETVLDGETGFYAKPYDVEDFASKLQALIEDYSLWQRLSKEARVWSQNFTWDKHIDIVESILDEQRR